MKILATALCLLMLSGLHAAAQVDASASTVPESAPGAPAAPGPGLPGAPGSPPTPAAAPMPAPVPTGDHIKLKSGALLTGVQVLRKSPLGVEIQVTPEVTFFVPRKQVVEITYDDVEPSKQRQPAVPVEPKEATFFGAKIEPAMSEKLNNPLPESCLKSANRDLVDIMGLISAETGVKIDVTEAVKKLAPKERVWNYTLDPGTTLTALIQSNLPQQFPNLAIVYQYDRLVITTRDDAASQTNAEAGNGVPAPAATQ